METNSTEPTVYSCKGIEGDWGSWPCIQALTMTIGFALVLGFSIMQFVQLMVLRRTVNRPLLVLFFLVVQSIMGIIHFGVASHVVIYYLIVYEKLLLLCTLSYFLHVAFLQLFHREYLRSWVAWPWLVFSVFSITVILVVAMVHVPDANNDRCYDVSFGLMDAAAITLSLTSLFSVSCFTVRLKQHHKTSYSTPCQKGMYQARLLQRLVSLFCLTSLAEAAGDIAIRVKDGQLNQWVCDGLVEQHSSRIGTIIVLLKVIDFIIPAFAVCYTFTIRLPKESDGADSDREEGVESVRLAMAASYSDFDT